MEVLEDNFTKKRTEFKEIICDNCGSKLKYERSDLFIGEYGFYHITCPLCGEQISLWEEEGGIDLNEDNIKFPQYFMHISRETGAKEMSEGEIERFIRDGIDYFKKNKDEFVYYCTCGDSFVFVFRFSQNEEYSIYVTKDFYELEVPFENISWEDKK